MHVAAERGDGDHHVRQTAQRGGGGGDADGGVPGVADQQRVGVQLAGVRRYVGLQSAGALLLRALHDQLEADRQVVAEGPQRGEVHDDVALAVGGAAPVPAAVALGELERRGGPGGVVERRLDVVVGVEQDGRRAGRRRAVAHHGVAAVRGLLQVDVAQSGLGEGRRDPLRGPAAVLRRVLARVGDGGEGDQLGEVGLGPRHQVGDPAGEFVGHGGLLRELGAGSWGPGAGGRASGADGAVSCGRCRGA